MLSKSKSKFVKICKIAEISSSDKLRLANKPDISKLSTSKPTIKPDVSSLSKSIVNKLNIADKESMLKPESSKIAIISGTLIADKL